MKRYGNLFDEIISIDNLTIADEKARKGKNKSYGVILHDRNKEYNINKLHKDLVNGVFKTSEYTTFTIYEPKERVIYRLPYYPDRILHHAIMNILEPIWVRTMTHDTYSCIKNRGIHLCAKKVRKALKDEMGTKYCLKLDIRKFYPSINHDILKKILRKKIKDERLLLLLDEIIESTEGIPIGNYLSQFFANLYLAYFDHWIKEDLKVKYYFRYADDIVVLGSNKDYLHDIFNKIKVYINELKLDIKNNYQIFPISDSNGRGLDFVGFVFYHKYIKVRKNIKKNMFRKAVKLNNKNANKKEYQFQLASYLGWCKYSNSVNLKRKLLNHEKSTI